MSVYIYICMCVNRDRLPPKGQCWIRRHHPPVYICLYVCLSVNVCMSVYICLYVCKQRQTTPLRPMLDQTSSSTCIYMSVCMSVCKCMYICIYICLYVCKQRQTTPLRPMLDQTSSSTCPRSRWSSAATPAPTTRPSPVMSGSRNPTPSPPT